MKIRSKAPLRLGIAGGGTDVSPYSDEFGGCVLNATINMYAYAYIHDELTDNVAIFEAKDLGISEKIDLSSQVELNGKLKLHRAVYKRIMDDYNNGEYIPLSIVTYSDAPPGSGLGSSSTMVVSMLEGLRQLLTLPLGEYDIACLAYEIERKDCGLIGGKQDQYAATFGGFNFIEFYSNDRVIVNPLRIRRYIINELEASLILFFTGKSRESATIIADQIDSLYSGDTARLAAMHTVKELTFKIKEHLFKADINAMAREFCLSWDAKKLTSNSITNPMIAAIENEIFAAGAKAMKVSGAGGGGFLMIFVDPDKKVDVIKSLEQFEGTVRRFQFIDEGCYSWTM